MFFISVIVLITFLKLELSWQMTTLDPSNLLVAPDHLALSALHSIVYRFNPSLINCTLLFSMCVIYCIEWKKTGYIVWKVGVVNKSKSRKFYIMSIFSTLIDILWFLNFYSEVIPDYKNTHKKYAKNKTKITHKNS